MFKEKVKKIIHTCFGSALHRTICVLLLLTLLTSWAISGVYAKFVKSATGAEQASVAGVGINEFVLKEHKPSTDNLSEMVKNNALHNLDMNNEIGGNYSEYSAVPPGVNIPKDSFVRLDINADVTYELYLRVKTTDNFPSTVTFDIRNEWKAVPGENGLYKYETTFAAGTRHTKTIEILVDNKLVVSDQYKSSDGSFGIEFEVYLQQTLTK